MRLVEGHGINDVDDRTCMIVDGRRVEDPYYLVWKAMLRRVYSPLYHAAKPTYIEASVCDEWLRFSAFKSWMMEQDWKDKQLDKDILVPGNKIYAPDRCLFVTTAINNLLLDRRAARGRYPQGVSWKNKKYQAMFSINGSNKYLGLYDTVEEASRAYRDAKSDYIRRIADEQTEPLRSALQRHADRIQHG